MADRKTGMVNWFSNTRGYGFITPEGGDKDVFVHFSNVQMKGYKTLREGQRVEFELGEIEKGGKMMQNALNVIVLQEPEDPLQDA
jgi:CspA family cold shock protein